MLKGHSWPKGSELELGWEAANFFSPLLLLRMVLEGNPDVVSPRTSDLQHPASKGSCILSSGEEALPGEEPIKYGELIVLG